MTISREDAERIAKVWARRRAHDSAVLAAEAAIDECSKGTLDEMSAAVNRVAEKQYTHTYAGWYDWYLKALTVEPGGLAGCRN